MLKWVGAALILFSGTAYGFVRASAYAKRPKELRYLAQALLTLETEIVYGVSPLPAALAACGRCCSAAGIRCVR